MAYKFTTFDGPQAGPVTINSINAKGDVVGFTTAKMNGADVNQNFIRKADGSFVMVDVGDPGGAANALNASGEVVGQANGVAFSLANGGKPTAINPFTSTASVALGVNDNGVVVGQYMKDAMTSPGFIDAGGTFTSVSPTQASVMTFVQSITAAGLAVGFYSEDGTTQHGFTYDVGTKQATKLPDPDTAKTAGGNLVLTQFLSVNASKMAAGYYQTKDGSQYGFLFDLGTMTYTYLDHPMAAPVMGVQITQITGIDDAGDLAGFFIDAQGGQHGFVAMK